MHWLVTTLIILACSFVIVFVVSFLVALKKVKTGKLQKVSKKVQDGDVKVKNVK